MANFVAVVDPESERRSLFVRKIRPFLPPTEELFISSCVHENFEAVWAAGAWAPVTHETDDDGSAIVWGEAISGLGPTRVDATQLRLLWNNAAKKLPDALDGFHAAITYNSETGLVAGADILGIFPIYYYASEEVILVGSSPELFRYHPVFRTDLSLKGLVGILLTNGLLDGQTLLSGVKRLGAGHLLIWKPGEYPKEILQYRVPMSTAHFNLSFHEHVEILDEALERAVSRHLPFSNKCCLLLSGGLDSRMLGGYLRRRGLNVTALTDGLPTDVDMRCASLVASMLGFKHYRVDIGFDNSLLFAWWTARWEHLSSGFHGVRKWGFCSHLRRLAPYVVASYLSDAIVGGLHISWARKSDRFRSKLNAPMSFEAFFKHMNDFGLRPDALRRLLRTEIFDDVVSRTMIRVREVYESYSKWEFQRAWCFENYHRQRFHVGSTAWALSFGAWPVLPFVDRELLRVIGGMPVTTLDNRRLQKELLCKKFPALARLPLDHSSYDTSPLQPTGLQRVKRLFHGDGGIWRLSRHARRLRRILMKRLLGYDPRYYYRLWDMNNSGWRAIRQGAERNRELALRFLNSDVLDKLLPSPDVVLRFDNEVVESSGLKILLGLFLWLDEHRE